MLGPTNRRRSRRLILATTFALVAQAMLVMVSPLADVQYHYGDHGPLQVAPAGSHHISQHAGPCPECMALQTLAVPGSPTLVLRSSWAREESPDPETGIGRPAFLSPGNFARAPPSPTGAIL